MTIRRGMVEIHLIKQVDSGSGAVVFYDSGSGSGYGFLHKQEKQLGKSLIFIHFLILLPTFEDWYN